jgi:hypothetical protein
MEMTDIPPPPPKSPIVLVGAVALVGALLVAIEYVVQRVWPDYGVISLVSRLWQ